MTALFNLDPAVELALVGGLLAIVAGGVVAWRAHRAGVRGWAAWQRALTIATLFLTVDLVMFGAFTRLTDSGLGCPDWPGCYGQASPWGAHAQIAAEQAVAPHGPVTHGKAWIEMIHRYMATTVGALITALMVGAWVGRQARGSLSPWWATLTFVWVCVQGAFGAFTVTLKLQPIIVTLHLLGALLGVALLTAQVRRLDHAPNVPDALPLLDAWRGAGLRTLGWVVLAAVALQVALGGWVSSNYAVLACADVPTCQGQWWPNMDFDNGFHLWRELGHDQHGEVIGMAALTAIHMSHRLMAVVLVVVVLSYAWLLYRWSPLSSDQQPWRTDAMWLIGLLLWQLLSGLSNIVLGWPLVAALAHTLGATLLVWRLVRVLVVPMAASRVPASSGVSLSYA